MITREDLVRWRNVKTLAISSVNIDPDICIAMQEMFIELKQLRKDNLKLLNSEDLLDKMAEYIRTSRAHHYVDQELEDLIGEIEDLIDSSDYDLEIGP